VSRNTSSSGPSTFDDPSAARRVYEAISEEGRRELDRPNKSLFWSGIIAGALMSLSLLTSALIWRVAEGHPASDLLVALGYPAGFLLVMLGHMQLFTENTITTVLPVLDERSFACVRRSALLWAIVLGANLLGAAAVSAAWVAGMLPESLQPAVISVAEKGTSGTFAECFAHAIPAGFIIAVLVWVTRRERQKVLIITFFTWLIAACHFKHVIVGAVEWFFLLWTKGASALSLGWTFFIPALLGNVVGGTLLFAFMAWAQVRKENEEAESAQSA